MGPHASSDCILVFLYQSVKNEEEVFFNIRAVMMAGVFCLFHVCFFFVVFFLHLLNLKKINK